MGKKQKRILVTSTPLLDRSIEQETPSTSKIDKDERQRFGNSSSRMSSSSVQWCVIMATANSFTAQTNDEPYGYAGNECLEHYGFVLSTNGSHASEVWCMCCKEAILLPDITVNNEWKQLDWIFVSKDMPPKCRRGDSCFPLRVRNNRVEAEVALTFFDSVSLAKIVGFAPPLGRVGVFYNHTMVTETYYRVWVTYIDKPNGTFAMAVKNYNLKWIVGKAEEPIKLTLFQFCDWDPRAMDKRFVERGVIVKMDENKVYLWKDIYGIVEFKKENVAIRLPNVGEFVKGAFTRDFNGTWHLCNAMPADGPIGIEPFDLLTIRDGEMMILLQVNPKCLKRIENSSPPAYESRGFCKVVDEDRIMDAYEGQKIAKVVIKWVNSEQIWKIANALLLTDLMDNHNSIIMIMHARVVKIEEVSLNEGTSGRIEKVVMTPSNTKPYEFYVEKCLFREPPVTGMWYQLHVASNLNRCTPLQVTRYQIPLSGTSFCHSSPFYVSIIRLDPLDGYLIASHRERVINDNDDVSRSHENNVHAISLAFDSMGV
uniref:Uncharacterized protein n=1 Tax=Acrobeloides nanus TaxID=290746 RepID=A0A914CSU2_9BILA